MAEVFFSAKMMGGFEQTFFYSTDQSILPIFLCTIQNLHFIKSSFEDTRTWKICVSLNMEAFRKGYHVKAKHQSFNFIVRESWSSLVNKRSLSLSQNYPVKVPGAGLWREQQEPSKLVWVSWWEENGGRLIQSSGRSILLLHSLHVILDL